MRSVIVATLAMLVIAPTPIQAADIHVPGEMPTIQAAILSAKTGDVVIVAEGEYFEIIDLNGKAITVRSTNPGDVGVVLNTIINGGEAGSVVTCDSGEGSETLLSGFVITGGNAANGGGMLNQGTSPTVTNCTFSGNSATRGGGVHNNGGSPMVINCTFSGNNATFGGGLWNQTGDPTLTNCMFSGNTAVVDGGGMLNITSNPAVTDCVFSGNHAGVGGGMWNQASNPTLINCSFSGNTGDLGGGMYSISSNPMMADTGFCGNTPDAVFGSYTDGGGNSLLFCPPAIPTPEPCPADIDDDGNVGIVDLLELLAAWGPCR